MQIDTDLDLFVGETKQFLSFYEILMLLKTPLLKVQWPFSLQVFTIFTYYRNPHESTFCKNFYNSQFMEIVIRQLSGEINNTFPNDLNRSFF